MIHTVDLDEIEVVLAVERACFGRDAWSEDLMRGAVTGGQHTVLIDGPDAYAAIRVVDDVADLDRIAVMPSRRREGIARELLAAALVVAHQQGARRMLLEVAMDNVAAISLYEAYGFTEISRRPGYYREGADALVMQRDLEDLG